VAFDDLPAAAAVNPDAKVPVHQNGQDELADLAQFIAAFPRTVSFPNSARALRVSERVLIGEAAEHFSGNVLTGDNGDSWLSGNGAGDPYNGYLAINAHFLVVTPEGKYAIVGAARNSDGGGGAIGVSGYVVNDMPGMHAWALYADVQHEAEGSWSAGLEIAVKNKAENLTSQPYAHALGAFGLWLPGGGDDFQGGAPANPSNTAIGIAKNGQTWNKGIIFFKDALTGCDGVNGEATAVELARGHNIIWRGPGGILGAQIKSLVNQSGKNVGLVFDNDGIMFIGANGTPILTVFHTPNAVNSVVFRDNVAGQPPGLQAYGADANIDLKLETKGAGRVRVGPFASSSDKPVVGYVEVKDVNGVVRKLAVIS